MWELDCEENCALITDAFELWCWRRLLRVPWIARRSNQSFLKEISPGCSLEGMMLKLKLQYFAHLMWRVDSLEKTLMLGGIGGRRRRGRQRMRRLDSITDSMDMSLSKHSRSWWWTGRPGVLQFMESQRVGHEWVTELKWTEPDVMESFLSCTAWGNFGLETFSGQGNRGLVWLASNCLSIYPLPFSLPTCPWTDSQILIFLAWGRVGRFLNIILFFFCGTLMDSSMMAQW